MLENDTQIFLREAKALNFLINTSTSILIHWSHQIAQIRCNDSLVNFNVTWILCNFLNRPGRFFSVRQTAVCIKRRRDAQGNTVSSAIDKPWSD